MPNLKRNPLTTMLKGFLVLGHLNGKQKEQSLKTDRAENLKTKAESGIGSFSLWSFGFKLSIIALMVVEILFGSNRTYLSSRYPSKRIATNSRTEPLLLALALRFRKNYKISF
ncbi:hypothetical protein D3C73_1316600 [compost metagenome]